MLDKSIPYKNIFMEIFPEKISDIKEPCLPEGFSFRLFKNGDEKYWADIETSVLEFDSEREAESYFKENYLPFKDYLKERCLFVINSKGIPVATATAWFVNGSKGYQPSLHWVAVKPDYQGLGLGKAVTEKALKIFSEKDSGRSVMLHTQTWSHKAVKLYGKLGFVMLSDKDAPARSTYIGFELQNNDYYEALEILDKVYERNNTVNV